MATAPRLIVVDDRPAAVRARLTGTGIEVWEVVRAYLEMGRDRVRLADAYHWIAPEVLDEALAYAVANAEAIGARVAEEYKIVLPGDLSPPPSWP